MNEPLTVGIVGLGGWGLRLARAIDSLPGAELRWLCDRDAARRHRAAPMFAKARTTCVYNDLVEDGFLDAIAIASPPPTHHDLARRALLRDKHVLIRDPVTETGSQADNLVRLARHRGCRLMIGQALLFHPAVRKLKELIEVETLGQIRYLYGTRRDLAEPTRPDVLDPADIGLILYLLGEAPLEVWARGSSHPGVRGDDVVHSGLTFSGGVAAYLQLCPLDARRDRTLAVVGSKATAVLVRRGTHQGLTVYEREGDVVLPSLPAEDPFQLAGDHFVSIIRSPASMALGAREGAATVHVLEALRSSLEGDGTSRRLRGQRSPAGRVLELSMHRTK